MRSSSATSSTSPGGNVLVDRVGVAQLHGADDGDDVLVAQKFGFFVNGGIGLFTEDDLGNAGAVAHVDENQCCRGRGGGSPIP